MPKSAPVDPFVAMDPRSAADDPTALRAELRRLQSSLDFRLEDNLPQVADELLGTCMHLLVHAKDPDRVELLATPIIDLVLADPTPSQRRALGRYLRFARERGGANGDATAVRLIGFLQRQGVDKLMTTRETIDVEQVIQTFPAQLLVWLDALQLREEDNHRQFQRLCEAVGDRALADVGRVLIDDGSLLTPNRTEKLLKFGGQRVAAVARMLAETEASWTRAQVVNYLRRQDLPRSESAALAIIQPITQLPTPFLTDLCRCVERNQWSAKIHGYSSLLLRHYIRDSANRPSDLDRRLYAIRALAHWPSPENRQTLEELARSGRLIAQSKEARAVRQAAAETIKQIREGARDD